MIVLLVSLGLNQNLICTSQNFDYLCTVNKPIPQTTMKFYTAQLTLTTGVTVTRTTRASNLQAALQAIKEELNVQTVIMTDDKESITELCEDMAD